MTPSDAQKLKGPGDENSRLRLRRLLAAVILDVWAPKDILEKNRPSLGCRPAALRPIAERSYSQRRPRGRSRLIPKRFGAEPIADAPP